MRRAALCLCILAVSLPAHALSRYATPTLTCARIQAILKEENAAILRYPSPRIADLTLYDIYVSNGRFCSNGEVGVTTYVPAKDTRQCRVMECRQRTSDENR
ncbi:hypothetical protein [Hoeflea prorocentri]|uniref:Uncharacterized protein n=1 Tax=Hoeflea prorocentri TaxID=1922333 RepID=A0A9X3UGL6_9HYPH|nr:hypothetical protein [Hoeflea prorocentri]MCY6380438.1 hypothetical protein [Hoeflea prorocentri]MDA5398238.1 hypothetical protein [Hoeflea prorocentri]